MPLQIAAWLIAVAQKFNETWRRRGVSRESWWALLLPGPVAIRGISVTTMQIKNLTQIIRRANDTSDPRSVFYQAMLKARTTEEYLDEVGDVVVVPPTHPRPMNATVELTYARDRRKWISEVNESPEGDSETPGGCDAPPDSENDARMRAVRSVIARQGQAKFRHALLRAYGGKCALTGCGIQPLLEAAHVTPYLGVHTNELSNGILLRADIHILWDLGLLAVHPTERTVHLNATVSVCDTALADLEGVTMRTPEPAHDQPSEARLRKQWEFFQKMQKPDGHM